MEDDLITPNYIAQCMGGRGGPRARNLFSFSKKSVRTVVPSYTGLYPQTPPQEEHARVLPGGPVGFCVCVRESLCECVGVREREPVRVCVCLRERHREPVGARCDGADGLRDVRGRHRTSCW